MSKEQIDSKEEENIFENDDDEKVNLSLQAVEMHNEESKMRDLRVELEDRKIEPLSAMIKH